MPSGSFSDLFCNRSLLILLPQNNLSCCYLNAMSLYPPQSLSFVEFGENEAPRGCQTPTCRHCRASGPSRWVRGEVWTAGTCLGGHRGEEETPEEHRGYIRAESEQ